MLKVASSKLLFEKKKSCVFRVCVETLLPDGVLFSIDCLAHKYDMATDDVVHDEKLVLHVQSISHWAPASIGPYSQSIKVGIFVTSCEIYAPLLK